MEIVALAGKARSGKDTAASVLIDNGFNKLSFADELKRITAKVAGHDLEEYYTDKKDESYEVPLVLTSDFFDSLTTEISFSFPVPYASFVAITNLAGKTVGSHRELLQFVGTDVGRDLIDPEIWTTVFANKAEELGRVVTPDARFPNERKLVNQLGGTNILIKRPDNEIVENSHSSENSLGEEGEYDFIINNNGTIEDLRTEVIKCFG